MAKASLTRIVATGGGRLDRWLTEQFPEHSRTTWQSWIRDGAVAVNGRVVHKTGYIVESDDTVVCHLPEDVSPSQPVRPAASSQGDRWIVYEDDWILVVNKPRGVVVHPARGHHGDTLVEQLWDKLADSVEPQAPERPGVVHRLDRDTTGLLLLARCPAMRYALSRMIQERQVRREYVALVWGQVDPPQGAIEAPIGRDPGNRLKMAAVYQGKSARTHYHTWATWPAVPGVRRAVSCLALRLDTGRMHQIRVHLAAAGYPVVGDPLYGHAPEMGFGAQALHAYRLQFHHPATGRSLVFEAMPPADWIPGIRALGPAAMIHDDAGVLHRLLQA